MADHFGELRSLVHTTTPSLEGWSALCGLLDSIEHLDEAIIDYTNHMLEAWPASCRVVPDRWWRALLAGEPCPQVAVARQLYIAGLPGEPDRVAPVLEAPVVDALERITLLSTRPGERCARALAGAGRFASLRELVFGEVFLDVAFCEALSGDNSLAQLEELTLSRCWMAPESLGSLLSSGALEGLRRLDLSQNKLSAEHLAPLLASSHRRSLRQLVVWGCSLDDASVAGLFAAGWPALELLDLRGNDLSVEVGDAVSVLGGMPRLRDLRLSYNAIGPQAFRALLTGLAESPLRRLDVADCQLAGEALSVLGHLAESQALEHLDLHGNTALEEGLPYLVQCMSLRTLMLRDTALAEHPSVTNLIASQLPQCRVLV